MNQFANFPVFPDATYTDVLRANADTLYSLMWFDVSEEPLLISVPDSGRPLLYAARCCDMWTDVFDSPGKRTTGTSAQVLAIAGPGWQGQLPADATLIHSPTAIGWILRAHADQRQSRLRRGAQIPGRTQRHPAQPMGEAVPAADRKDQSRLGHEDTARRSRSKRLVRRHISRCSPSSPNSTRRTRTTTRSSTRCGALESSRASPSRSTRHRLRFSAP